MRSVSGVGRVAALAAVIGAILLVGYVLFVGGAGGYQVKAKFLNGGQLVKGNLVQVGGSKAGSIDAIEITPDGQALVTMTIDEGYAPLKVGTRATIRVASLSGIANRYVDLSMPPSNQPGAQDDIEEGATIGVDETTTAVDLDQLFATLDPPTRVSVQDFLKGSANQFRRRGPEANRGYQYLNPALSTSRRLFGELNADTPLLESFIVDSAKFMTAVAERRDDLSALIGNLNRFTGALGREKQALADAINAFPDFMRSANTTFVQLRSTLDDVDPLVEASKPVAPRLAELLDELRPFARDARPTVRDLNDIIRRRGDANDLTELNRTFPALAEVALDRRRRNGAMRDGAFPETERALKDSADIIAFGRPYTTDLFGWFDDFSNTGVYDALGGISRTQNYFNVFTPAPSALGPAGFPLINRELLPFPYPPFLPDPLSLRDEAYRQFANINQFKRCPGAAEDEAFDKSNVWSAEQQKQLDCLEEDRATGDRSP